MEVINYTTPTRFINFRIYASSGNLVIYNSSVPVLRGRNFFCASVAYLVFLHPWSVTAADRSLWSKLAGSKPWSAPTLDLGKWDILQWCSRDKWLSQNQNVPCLA